jgi:hypothetical protein
MVYCVPCLKRTSERVENLWKTGDRMREAVVNATVMEPDVGDCYRGVNAFAITAQ